MSAPPKRLTLSGTACVEILAVLITVAWADGRLDDAEKEGVRGAAKVLNLTKELRERLEDVLASPVPLDGVLVEALSPKERAFAYVAAAWMSGVDDDVDEKEEAMLDKLADALGYDAVRKAELETVARDIPRTDRKWSDQVIALFKAIPPRLEKEDIDVVFE